MSEPLEPFAVGQVVRIVPEKMREGYEKRAYGGRRVTVVEVRPGQPYGDHACIDHDAMDVPRWFRREELEEAD